MSGQHATTPEEAERRKKEQLARLQSLVQSYKQSEKPSPSVTISTPASHHTTSWPASVSGTTARGIPSVSRAHQVDMQTPGLSAYPRPSGSSISSLSLSTGMEAQDSVGTSYGIAGSPAAARVAGRSAPSVSGLSGISGSAAGGGAVAKAAASIRSQVSSLGQQLSEMYRRSEGEGLAPPLLTETHHPASTTGPPASTVAGSIAAASALHSRLQLAESLSGSPPRPLSSHTHSGYGVSTTKYSAAAPARPVASLETTAALHAAIQDAGKLLNSLNAPVQRSNSPSRSYSPGHGYNAGAAGASSAARALYDSPSRAQHASNSAGATGYMPSPPPRPMYAAAAHRAPPPHTAAYSGSAAPPPAGGAPSGYSGTTAGLGLGAGNYSGGYGAAGANASAYAAYRARLRATGVLPEQQSVAPPAVHTSTSHHWDTGSSGTGIMGAAAAGVGGLGLQGAGGSARDREGSIGSAALVLAREESRLIELVQELRHERRRLEDKLLSGASQSTRAQEMRDELEKQIGALARYRDSLESEAGSLAEARQVATLAIQEAESLRTALHQEQEFSAQLQEVRAQVEGRLTELAAAVDGLQHRHSQELSAVTQERDHLAKKLHKAVGKVSTADTEASHLRAEVEALKKEVQARDLSLAEVKASAEVLRQAHSQMQAQLSASNSELEGRAGELARMLESATREAAEARALAGGSQEALREAQAQAKEAGSRAEFLRSEREKLLKVLAAEQATTAALRKDLETLAAQSRATDAARGGAEATLKQQLEAVHREADLRVQMLTKQFEAQLSAAETAASSAQQQYESSVHSGEKLLEVHNALRRERDALSAEVDSLKQQLGHVQHERDELSAKVGLLRAEVRSAMDDVLRDREARVAAAAQQHDVALAELRAHYEGKLAALSSEGDSRMAGMLELGERLRGEVAESQRASEKQRATVALLKEELKECLKARDELERELASERAFNRELNALVQQSKAAKAEAPW